MVALLVGKERDEWMVGGAAGWKGAGRLDCGAACMERRTAECIRWNNCSSIRWNNCCKLATVYFYFMKCICML